jgi:hypothetical protein
VTPADPHIHVQRTVLRDAAEVRNVLASTWGLAADAPKVVTTGCGLEVPFAMTSPHPESVTCLACREHAHREHLRYAEQIEHLSQMPGAIVTADQATTAAKWHRDVAARFSG